MTALFMTLKSKKIIDILQFRNGYSNCIHLYSGIPFTNEKEYTSTCYGIIEIKYVMVNERSQTQKDT